MARAGRPSQSAGREWARATSARVVHDRTDVVRRFASKPKPWWRDGRKHPEHLFIPDTQVRADVPIEHVRWAAQYATDNKPDVIVLAMDWWDFPSLNSHETEYADFRTRDFLGDFCAGLHAWDLFFSTLRKVKGYDPLIVATEGNHEARVTRTFQLDRRMRRGIPSPRWVASRTPGVVWAPFQSIVSIDGICYSHFFSQPLTGKPIGGTALNKLTRLKFSFTQGHVQTKETAEQHLANGAVIRGLVAGAFYQHDEDYKGQGNAHWRGILYKHEVRDGHYDLMEVSMDYLRRRYGGKPVLADPEWRAEEFARDDEEERA